MNVLHERGDHHLKLAVVERDLFGRLFELGDVGFGAGEVYAARYRWLSRFATMGYGSAHSARASTSSMIQRDKL